MQFSQRYRAGLELFPVADGRPPCSPGLGRNIIYSRLVRNPVDLPCLASIIRERLFKVRCIPGGIGPNKSNVDGAALPRLLVVKLTTSILELADHGLFYKAILAVGPIDTPLMRLRIVKTK